MRVNVLRGTTRTPIGGPGLLHMNGVCKNQNGANKRQTTAWPLAHHMGSPENQMTLPRNLGSVEDLPMTKQCPGVGAHYQNPCTLNALHAL